MMRSPSRPLAVALALASGAAVAVAHPRADADLPELPESFAEPIPLYSAALGPFRRPISSTNPESQAFFDQGFQLLYAFGKEAAARSFREAWRRDPECAICYWGEAWAWGPYLNGKMEASEAPHALRAIRKAASLLDGASPVERALIEAMQVRYVEDYDPDDHLAQDQAYADAMRDVAERFPDDLDVQTLYAESLFLMEPRRGYRDLADPDVQRIHQILEGVLAADIRHPGACHLYVHATESTTRPDLAEPCVAFLGSSIPGASHINHMPSHTWNRVGRWGDSVRANLQAWHSDQKTATGEGVAIYPAHNLHMLLFAASMDGQGAIALQAGRDYAARTGSTIYRLLTLLRFGRFDEILEVTERDESDFGGAVWDFAQGYARLRAGEADFARLYLARVRATAEKSEGEFRQHPVGVLLDVLAGLLEGEIHRADGDLPAAIDAFERAVTAEDGLDYDEPEPLPFPARHWLGAALLEAERPADAERVYREELEEHPHNGWSLFGLQAALRAEGGATAEVDADLEASWARADTWLRGSRY
jgi:tetratricopeptide (TPR) repeat protein